jgi:hypothetical protein
MKRPVAAAVLALGLLFAGAGRAEGQAAKRHAPLLDGGKDRIVRSAFVPAEGQPQGEVHLIRRGDAVVMQTVLYSKFMKRVVAEIRNKERPLWPATRKGHADSLRYLDALMKADARIRQRPRRGETGGERRRKLLIEFILSEKAALVAFFEPEIKVEEGHYRVTAKRPITVLELSRAYVRGDIYEIAWDALTLTREESEKLLEPMLPPEPAGKDPEPGKKGP